MIAALRTFTFVITILLAVTLAITYLSLVILGYVTEGPRYRFTIDVRDPVYSARRLLVGLGVRLAAGMLRLGTLLLAPLFEASAEVGEWLALHSSPETRANLRSRFK